MKHIVSKSRARKTRKRQKQAGKGAGGPIPFSRSPVVGLLIGCVLWLITVPIVSLDALVRVELRPAVLLPQLGDAAFMLLGLFFAALLLRINQPEVTRRNRDLLVLAVVSLIAVLLAKAILTLSSATTVIDGEIAQFLLPLALAPLLTTMLVSQSAGLAVGVWTSTVMAVAAGRSLPVLLTGLLAAGVASSISAHLRTRAKVLRAGTVVGLTQVLAVSALTAINWRVTDIMTVFYSAGACVAAGFASAIIVLLILPAFESLFGITTDITLLELSDLGHPLLQRLALEAPGTYHHSLLVAQLAQAAADEIGANALLARVASYFHDVGKLTKPEFFTENIRMQSNPHDQLLPSMSTLVITAHVKEGVSLAVLHKLPDPILRAITEHHGTSLISYFHHKAASNHEKQRHRGTRGQDVRPARIDENDFRYGGPRPSSRETGIICLADAVEAASRSIEKTTPGHIESLVHDIVKGKVDDGQLDDSGLTLNEISRIRRCFVFTLTNMLHGRVPYPRDEDRHQQQAEAPPAEPADIEQAG